MVYFVSMWRVIRVAHRHVAEPYSYKGATMNLNIARWGNSLALRIPADYARRAGIKEGDKVEARLTTDGGIAIRSARWNRKVFAQELARTRDAMPMGTSAMDELRHGARYSR